MTFWEMQQFAKECCIFLLKGDFGKRWGFLCKLGRIGPRGYLENRQIFILESYMFAHKKPRDILWTFYKRKRKLIFPVYILAKNSFLKLSFSLLSISRFVRYIRCKKNATLFSIMLHFTIQKKFIFQASAQNGTSVPSSPALVFPPLPSI